MLQRLPATNAVFLAQKHAGARKIITAAFGPNKLLVEGINGVRRETPSFTFHEAYDPVVSDIVLPRRPSEMLIPFAIDVAGAWDSISTKERREAGLPNSFHHPQSTDSCLFGNHRASPRSLASVIEWAKTGSSDSRRIWALGKYLKGTKDGKVIGVLARANINLTTIHRAEDGTVTYSTLDEIRVTLKQPAEVRKDAVSKLYTALTGIARRLVIGFHPDLFKESEQPSALASE